MTEIDFLFCNAAVIYMNYFFAMLLRSSDSRDSFLNPPVTTSHQHSFPDGIPLLYFRKMAMVKGQILLSTLAVNSGSTVQTMHRVSITRLRTSELNWAAR